MSRSRTIDKDLGFHSIVSDLETLGETSVDIGFFDDGTLSHDGMIEMVELAMLQHNGGESSWDGASDIPSRPFMDKTAIDHGDEIGAEMHYAVGDVIDKKDFAIKRTLKVGEKYKKMMQDTIESIHTPPNSEATIKASIYKNASDPLIDSGKMIDSIEVKLTENF